MSKNVIAFPAPRMGRPSNSDLSQRVRALEAEREEMDLELVAFVTERLSAAAETRALARRARMFVDAGQSPVRLLDELERLGNREQIRALGMRDLGGAA